MLVLCGPTYPQRLWCAWELCTLFSFMREEQAIERVELLSLSASDIMEELTKFDVRNAHCYDPNEEAKLRTVIHAVGQAQFNKRIRNLAKACVRNASRRTSIVEASARRFKSRLGSFSVTGSLLSPKQRSGSLSTPPSSFALGSLNSQSGSLGSMFDLSVIDSLGSDAETSISSNSESESEQYPSGDLPHSVTTRRI
eukprot:FR740484.1.p1 GENE.FR740484.1~~FR740484.1.p1  ORF type:complete len:225 (+),score=3.23 FR740484.1:85-675(+)